MCPSGGNLHRNTVAQQLIGSQVGLIQRDAGTVSGSLQFLQGGGDMRVGIAAFAQVCPQVLCFDSAIILACVPVTEEVISETVPATPVCKQMNDALLRQPFGAGSVNHKMPAYAPVSA